MACVCFPRCVRFPFIVLVPPMLAAAGYLLGDARRTAFASDPEKGPSLLVPPTLPRAQTKRGRRVAWRPFVHYS